MRGLGLQFIFLLTSTGAWSQAGFVATPNNAPPTGLTSAVKTAVDKIIQGNHSVTAKACSASSGGTASAASAGGSASPPVPQMNAGDACKNIGLTEDRLKKMRAKWEKIDPILRDIISNNDRDDKSRQNYNVKYMNIEKNPSNKISDIDQFCPNAEKYKQGAVQKFDVWSVFFFGLAVQCGLTEDPEDSTSTAQRNHSIFCLNKNECGGKDVDKNEHDDIECAVDTIYKKHIEQGHLISPKDQKTDDKEHTWSALQQGDENKELACLQELTKNECKNISDKKDAPNK